MHLSVRQYVLLAATVVNVAYLIYRIVFTLNLATEYAAFASLLLYGAEFLGVISLVFYFLQIWDPRDPPALPPLEDRSVDVLVPTYNEDVALLRNTLQACLRMDYPHRTYVLDDGHRPDVAALAKELGVHYLTRPDNRHAKAGNLNHALDQTTGEFIIIFDADHVPAPNFITRLIGYFRDEKLAWIQTPHAFYNFDSFQARLNRAKERYWEEGQIFYEVIQLGRNRWNAAIFAGSAAMFRRRALEEVGYIAIETITEDMHTGLRLHARGWKSLAVRERLIAGQAAPDVTTFQSQRLRWGEGNLSILAYDNPLTIRGLTLAQRLCYLGTMMHWTSGWSMLALYLTPILMLFTGVPPVAEFSWTLLAFVLGYLVVNWFALRVGSYGYWSFWNTELFGMATFPLQIRASWRALFRRSRQRFVVTSKRGRQTASLWLAVRPQSFLVALSLLALIWGWYQPLLGVSADYYRPIVASCWVLFHAGLGVVVLYRSFWTEGQRFAYRHEVQLPVLYALAGGNSGKIGMTEDLDERGLALVAYERLPVGSVLHLSIHGPGSTVNCDGRIRWAAALAAPAENDPAAWRGFRHGLSLEKLQPEQQDAINRICFEYAVPEHYRLFDAARKPALWHRLIAEDSDTSAAEEPGFAHACRLPLALYSPSRADVGLFTVTQSIGRRSLVTLLERPLGQDETPKFRLATPLGEIRGVARPYHQEPYAIGARAFSLCWLTLPHFEGQGRVTLQAILASAEASSRTPLLNPQSKRRQANFARPLLIGLCVSLVLVAGELALLERVYRDDRFLHALARTTAPVTADQRERLNAILTATLAQRRPNIDRILLLVAAVKKAEQPTTLDALVQALALQAPRNLELQRASAQAYDNLHEYAKAEAQYQRLLLRARNGSLSASQQTELLLAAARGRVHAGDFETAAERYRQLLPSCPNDLALRNEFAGVLLAARRPAEAAALYQGVQPDLQGRQLLAVIHMQLHDFDAAEHDCREALRLQPEDPHTEALFAELLSARSDFKQARALFERLLRADPTNRTLQLRLAQTTLADGSYKSAIDLFQALLEGGDSNQREVIRGFIDAAAALPDLGAMHRKAVEALYQRAPTLLAEDAVYLARLAWALCKLEDFDQSIQLLQQARKVAPSDARIRDQLVGALLAADRWRDAIQLLEHERRDRAARELLVSLYLRAQDFPAAERECRALLTENPTDRSTKRLLADILCWRKQYAPALALLEGVARAEPADEELQAHLAEVTLWSGDYATALARYRALPEAVLADPHEWSGYINAAAGAPTLTTADVDRAVHIAERLLDGKPDDPQLLSRLAWILQRGQRKDLSQAVVRKAAALHPKDPALRRELAGVLAVLGENRLAMQMYEGLPLDREDRFRLAGIYSAEKDYDAAEQECRALLRLDAHDSRAQRYLADVLTWKRAYPQALVLWNRLLQADPTNIDLEARRAEVMLWSGDYGEALRDFEALVRKTTDRPSLCRGFVDAAASAKSLTPEQSQLIVQLADRALPELVSDVRFLARLAWVLHQIGEQDRSRRMLEKALALHPPTPGLRRELASVLAAVGMYAEAVQMFEGVDLNVPDRFQLIGIYSADKDFEAAERACRALLQRQPGDAVAERLLADILSWKGKYAEAAALYTKLAQARPQDQGLAIRRAEVTLWSGEYDLALRQYGFLLKRDRGQPRLWASFIDAASSALKLPEEYKPLVLYIEGRTSADSHDPVYLSRLAWVLRRLHEPGQAVGLLQRALALEESSRSLKLQLAETLLEMGRYADAERYFHELMQTKPPPANKK